MTTIPITLFVPEGREECASWMSAQTPSVVADLLEMCATLHQTMTSATKQKEVVDLVSTHEEEMKSVHAMLDKLRAEKHELSRDVQERLKSVRDDCEEQKRMARTSLVAQYDEQLSYLRGMVERREEDMKQLQQSAHETTKQMQQLVATLGGKSSFKGKVGERFVQNIHDELELGVLRDVSAQRAVGHGDFRWEYAPGSSSSFSPLTALVEVKFSQNADRDFDVQKFVTDVGEAAAQDRINAALYLSLSQRIGGRPVLSLELVHGVPTLWASRNADDEMSATQLVKMAFLVFAQMWPLIQPSDKTQMSVQKLNALVKHQCVQFAAMDQRIAHLDKLGDSVKREAEQLRKLKEALIASTKQIHDEDDDVVVEGSSTNAKDLLDGDVGRQLMDAIRRHHAERGHRYATRVDDLQNYLDVEAVKVVASHPGLFEMAKDKIKRSNYVSGQGKKRRVAESSDATS